MDKRVLLVAVISTLMAALASPRGRVFGEDSPGPGISHALILVGLPGDAEHEKLFATTAWQWHEWLSGSLDFDPANVHVLFGDSAPRGVVKGPTTYKTVEGEIAKLKQSLQERDRLWVFFLGHANYDGEHVWFHLPGPDMNEEQLAQLFDDVGCREQVFWMTTSASGWFLRRLSAAGRIVITATAADQEINETEFPHALSTVMNRSHDQRDTNRDGKVSLLEMYHQALAETQARFAADNRVTTEHAQLDDNGDGVGTEQPVDNADVANKGGVFDGALAARTFLPFKRDVGQQQIER